ncbi:MAG: GNAT family N-acetyltransferase, partial [Hyphomicrobiaceae bacterium]
MSDRLTIAKLTRRHDVEAFDCGKEPLNRFLVRYALTSQAAGASQTYVALNDTTVLGYYTLVVGEVAYETAAE